MAGEPTGDRPELALTAFDGESESRREPQVVQIEVRGQVGSRQLMSGGGKTAYKRQVPLHEVPHGRWTVGRRRKLRARGGTPTASSRKVYAPGFKFQAVATNTGQKFPAAEVARRLEAAGNRPHDGKEAVRGKGADALPGSGHRTFIGEQPRCPRADRKRPEVGRDILRKAAASLATRAKRLSPGPRDAAAGGR